jgi:LAO/AO transport system kinase
MKSKQDVNSLADAMLAGDVRALSRLMTIVETSPDDVPEIMSRIYGARKTTRRVGISGPPGAGKSTLLSNLIDKAHARGEKVGVLCIDPTSPISGGAILGDRIRINEQFPPEKVFIRSVASGDSLGGLAGATKLQTLLLEAAGCDLVLIETVGLGQVGYDIRDIAETLVLVLVPESGDTIQILKSGIIELADIVVVNKSDRAGSEEIAESLRTTFLEPRDGWVIPVVRMISRDDDGTDELVLRLDMHLKYLNDHDRLGRFRDGAADFTEAIAFQLKRALPPERLASHPAFKQWHDGVAAGRMDPYTAAAKAIENLLGR